MWAGVMPSFSTLHMLTTNKWLLPPPDPTWSTDRSTRINQGRQYPTATLSTPVSSPPSIHVIAFPSDLRQENPALTQESIAPERTKRHDRRGFDTR